MNEENIIPYHRSLEININAYFVFTKYVYGKMVCLPSWYGCPYKEVVKQILEFNR